MVQSSAMDGGRIGTNSTFKVRGSVTSEVEEFEEWVFDDCRPCEMDDARIFAQEEYQASWRFKRKCAGLQVANNFARSQVLDSLERFSSDTVSLPALAAAVKALKDKPTPEQLAQCTESFVKGGAPKSKVEVDDQGGLQIQLEFYDAEYNDHGGQYVEIKVKVSPSKA